jgi:integrase
MSEADKLAQFTAKLVGRLRKRSTADGVVWMLDLRHRLFGNRGRLNVYRPGEPGWPLRGETTASKETAESWLYEDLAYARWLSEERIAPQDGGPSQLTTDAAADRYMKHLERKLGSDHNTTGNRRSAIEVHIKPLFGRQPIRALNRTMVRPVLQGIRVTKRVDGETFLVPAAVKTLENIRAALVDVWNFNYPDEVCPYAGIGFKDDAGAKTRRTKIVAGDVFDLVPKRTMTVATIEHILLTALWLDQRVLERPCQRSTYVPLTAEAIAGLYATASRVSEIARLQWRHVRAEDGAIVVPGTKTTHALRAVPLQRAFHPWLERIERQALERGRRADRDNVFAMRHRGSNTEKATPGQLIERVNKVLFLAGCKFEQQSTHILRRSHATEGERRDDLISSESLKSYLGHEDVHGGATDAYIDRDHLELMIAQMRPQHREYIKLPSPEQVLAKLPGFTPPAMQGKSSLEEVWAQRKREFAATLRKKAERDGRTIRPNRDLADLLPA